MWPDTASPNQSHDWKEHEYSTSWPCVQQQGSEKTDLGIKIVSS